MGYTWGALELLFMGKSLTRNDVAGNFKNMLRCNRIFEYFIGISAFPVLFLPYLLFFLIISVVLFAIFNILYRILQCCGEWELE